MVLGFGGHHKAEAKGRHFLLRVTMLSGKSCCTAVHIRDAVVWPHEIVHECCEKLSIPRTGSEELLYGSEACKNPRNHQEPPPKIEMAKKFGAPETPET
eukprot:5905969-Amphidinium_carterae.1